MNTASKNLISGEYTSTLFGGNPDLLQIRDFKNSIFCFSNANTKLFSITNILLKLF